MAGAAVLQFASKYASIAVQLLVTAVLARLVSPDDFGLISIVTVFSAFFQLFSDMGVGVSVVQFRDLDEGDFGALFGFSCVLAVVLAALFCIASFPISVFYGDRELVPLCLASVPTLILSTLNMVPNGLMLRERRFAAIGVRLICATVISGVAAVLLALAGAGCYAPVIQMGVQALVVLVWNMASRPLSGISVHFKGTLRRIFSYTAYQFGFSFINYFSRNLDNIVTGRVFGAASLGYYDKAYKLTTYPLSSITSVVSSVVQPFMAEKQDDRGAIFECFLKVEKAMSLVGAAVAAIFISSSKEIIVLFYGPQWGESVPLFATLSASVYFQMLSNPTGAFFQSLGRTDLMFRSGFATAVLTVGAVICGALSGSVRILAGCISLAYCLQVVPLVFLLFKKGFGVSASKALIFLPELVVAVVAATVAAAISPWLPSSLVLRLLIKISVAFFILALGYVVTGQLKWIHIISGQRRG